MSQPTGEFPKPRRWVSRTVVGIVVATFFSDVGHEMVTAVLPMYLASVGLGAAALGVMEGLADLLFALSKLAGGMVGHRVKRKRPWATLGYLTTTLGTGGMALVQSTGALISLRAGAWFGRGFRAPLRDFLLADAVPATHFGRAYGIERTSDMLGAVAGPLLGTLLIALGFDLRTVILVSVLPSLASALSIFFFTTEREVPGASDRAGPAPSWTALPRRFWLFLGGVLLFGLGDFSRTFLILLASRAFASGTGHGALSTAVLLYAFHNLMSAAAAYPVGRMGDRGSKLHVLTVGYGLGVVTNVVLALGSGSIPALVLATLLSGIYIAVEETLEKAVAVELLPRDFRSAGLGILATANAAGDMASSLSVGILLDRGHPELAFAIPAVAGAAGVAWMLALVRRTSREASLGG